MDRIEALGASDRGCEVDNVLERRVRILRIGGRRLQEADEAGVLVEQRLVVGIEICRRDSEFIRPADFGRNRVGEILVRTHHFVARQIKVLARQVRQRLLRIDLRAALAQIDLKSLTALLYVLSASGCAAGCAQRHIGYPAATPQSEL
jgi:hypothetical protein